MADVAALIMAQAPSVEAAEATGAMLMEQESQESKRPAFDDEVFKLDESENLNDTLTALVGIMEGYETHPRRQRQEEIWTACYLSYMGYKHPGVSYSIKETWRQQETLESQIHDQILGTDPLFTLRPHAEGGEEKAQAAGRLMIYQLKNCDRGRSYESMRQFLSNTSKYGNGYITHGWQKYKQTQYKTQKAHAQGEKDSIWKRESSERPVSCPYLTNIDPWDIYTHPYISDVQECPVVFWRIKVSVGYLKTRVREGFLDKDWTEEAVNAGGAADTMLTEKHPDGRSHDSMSEMSPDGTGAHELLVAWTNDGWEYVMIDRKWMVRGKRLWLGQMPIEAAINHPQPGEHFGIPDPLVILDEQRMVNDLATDWFKGTKMTMMPMVKGTASAKKAWQNAKFQVGGFVELAKMDELQVLEMNPAIQGMPNAINYIIGNMQSSSGITPELSGTGSSAKTATAHVRLQDAAGMRIKHAVRLLSMCFQNIYKTLYQLNQAFNDEEQVLSIVGINGKAIPQKYSPEDFNQYCDVDIELGNVGETSMEKVSKWMQFGQTFIPLGTCDPLMIQDRVLRAMGEQRPQQFRMNPLDGRDDQMWELGQLPMGNVMPNPRPQDNHQQHLQVLQMFMQSQAFEQLPPAGKFATQSHLMMHQSFFAQQQEAQQQQMMMQQQQQMPGGGQTPVNAEANARTEAEFNNGQRGAEQQGAMQ